MFGVSAKAKALNTILNNNTITKEAVMVIRFMVFSTIISKFLMASLSLINP
ncbi:MAG: hypothetical protein ACI971_001809 [Colwellia sp.]|jgi:hypothetical protein